MTMYRTFLKRVIDFFGSFIIILVMSPFLLIIAILIKIDSPGPVFFKQKRLGKGLKDIVVLKFRSMTDEEREVSKVIGRADGVTRTGYYLRRFKIDELPQIINVLMGDMSMVGPRPSIREQLDDMTDEEKKRYSVRPGMTGLAQVCGNIHLSWKERYKYDLLYVNNITFLNDMRIILRTVLIIIKGEEHYIDQPLSIREGSS